MAELLFVDSSGAAVRDSALTADFMQAQRCGRARVGGHCLYYRQGLQQRFVPLAEIDRAFRRIEPLQSRVCCGISTRNRECLVVCAGTEDLAVIELEDETQVFALLKLLKARLPEMAVGVRPPPETAP